MKTSFIIFTLIGASLESDLISQTNLDSAITQHQPYDLAAQVMPQTPDGQVHRATFRTKHGRGQIEAAWTPNKFQARAISLDDLGNGDYVARKVSAGIYNEGGVNEEDAHNVAQNLYAAFNEEAGAVDPRNLIEDFNQAQITEAGEEDSDSESGSGHGACMVVSDDENSTIEDID